MPVWWTKRSLPPSSGVTKPKPLSSLNHFTVPLAMIFLHGLCALRTRRKLQTATTAGAEHSVVERDAPDLNTTQRTARISNPQQHRRRRAGLGRRPWRNNVCYALSPHSRRGEGEAFSGFADSPYAMARLRPTRLGAVEPGDASGRAGARPLQSERRGL